MATIVLTNDDGIEAPGLQTLYRALEGFGERIVIAPSGPRSGAGHAVTTHEPIHVSQVRDGWLSVSGTPADCSRLALTHFASAADWVVSGINRGGNLGADTYISGTVAAAREAAFFGRKAIAISQYVRPDLEVDWEWTLRQSAATIRTLLSKPLAPGSFWNVNLPHLPRGAADPQVVYCGLDVRPLDVKYAVNGVAGGVTPFVWRGNYHGRERQKGRDVEVCFSGAIAATVIPLDITR
jgi:5'-nucleotidase